jgi:uncharacterized lipoprotein YehR (DUF1307 family)
MKLTKISVIAVSLVVICFLALSGCGKLEQDVSHFKSKWIGLDRTITLYANDGKPIKKWDCRSQVEDNGGSFRFMSNGKAVQISGTIVIEEK